LLLGLLGLVSYYFFIAAVLKILDLPGFLYKYILARPRFYSFARTQNVPKTRYFAKRRFCYYAKVYFLVQIGYVTQKRRIYFDVFGGSATRSNFFHFDISVFL